MLNDFENDMGSFLQILKENKAVENLREDIALEKKDEAPEVPQTVPVKEKPDIEAEDFELEDYSEEDLTKVKSKSLKDEDHKVKEMPDKDFQNPPVKKTKESLDVPLCLCNNCHSTFRSAGKSCPKCYSNMTERIVKEVAKPPFEDEPEDKPQAKNDWKFHHSIPVSITGEGENFEEGQVEIDYELDLDIRSWGIKGINVVPLGEVSVKGKTYDLSEAQIDWVAGAGFAPQELLIDRGKLILVFTYEEH